MKITITGQTEIREGSVDDLLDYNQGLREQKALDEMDERDSRTDMGDWDQQPDPLDMFDEFDDRRFGPPPLDLFNGLDQAFDENFHPVEKPQVFEHLGYQCIMGKKRSANGKRAKVTRDVNGRPAYVRSDGYLNVLESSSGASLELINEYHTLLNAADIGYPEKKEKKPFVRISRAFSHPQVPKAFRGMGLEDLGHGYDD